MHYINLIYIILVDITDCESSEKLAYIDSPFILFQECRTHPCRRPSRQCPRRHSKFYRHRPSTRDNERRDIRVSCIYGIADLSSVPLRRRWGTCDVPRWRSPTNRRVLATAFSGRSRDLCRTLVDEFWLKSWPWLAWILISKMKYENRYAKNWAFVDSKFYFMTNSSTIDCS